MTNFENLSNLLDGWGDGNEPDAGSVQICESWAEHLGETYAHRQFGTNNSVGGTLDNWETQLESIVMRAGHVPVGLHHDLWDNNSVGTENTAITDQVRNFTILMMFNSLNNNVTSIPEYQNFLNTNHLGSTPNSIVDYNQLFQSYGY